MRRKSLQAAESGTVRRKEKEMGRRNEGLKLIETRRSVRKFKPDMVPKEILEQILEAGSYAPTALNRQSPIMIAITKKAVRDRLSRLNSCV